MRWSGSARANSVRLTVMALSASLLGSSCSRSTPPEITREEASTQQEVSTHTRPGPPTPCSEDTVCQKNGSDKICNLVVGVCTRRRQCGNGRPEIYEGNPHYMEECDDGNKVAQDGCTPDCKRELSEVGAACESAKDCRNSVCHAKRCVALNERVIDAQGEIDKSQSLGFGANVAFSERHAFITFNGEQGDCRFDPAQKCKDVSGVEVFRIDGDKLTYQTTIENTGSEVERFAKSMAAGGFQLAIGEGFEDGWRIHTYAEQNEHWVSTGSISPPESMHSELPRVGRGFGSVMALGKNTLVVGLSWERCLNEERHSPECQRDPRTMKGRVLVYYRDVKEWKLAQTLVSPRTGASPGFGSAVAIQGSRLIVADTSRAACDPKKSALAPLCEIVASVNVYERSDQGWNHKATITADDKPLDLGFGSSISLGGNRIAVGANKEADCRPQDKALDRERRCRWSEGAAVEKSGAVYIFDLHGDSWKRTDKLRPYLARSFGGFGSKVELDFKRIAVSSDGRARISCSGSHDVVNNFSHMQKGRLFSYFCSAPPLQTFVLNQGVWTFEASLFSGLGPMHQWRWVAEPATFAFHSQRLLVGYPQITRCPAGAPEESAQYCAKRGMATHFELPLLP